MYVYDSSTDNVHVHIRCVCTFMYILAPFNNGDASNMRDAILSYLILGCQFDLPHMSRRAVVSRYMTCMSFGIIVESSA